MDTQEPLVTSKRHESWESYDAHYKALSDCLSSNSSASERCDSLRQASQAVQGVMSFMQATTTCLNQEEDLIPQLAQTIKAEMASDSTQHTFPLGWDDYQYTLALDMCTSEGKAPGRILTPEAATYFENILRDAHGQKPIDNTIKNDRLPKFLVQLPLEEQTKRTRMLLYTLLSRSDGTEQEAARVCYRLASSPVDVLYKGLGDVAPEFDPFNEWHRFQDHYEAMTSYLDPHSSEPARLRGTEHEVREYVRDLKAATWSMTSSDNPIRQLTTLNGAAFPHQAYKIDWNSLDIAHATRVCYEMARTNSATPVPEARRYFENLQAQTPKSVSSGAAAENAGTSGERDVFLISAVHKLQTASRSLYTLLSDRDRVPSMDDIDCRTGVLEPLDKLNADLVRMSCSDSASPTSGAYK